MKAVVYSRSLVAPAYRQWWLQPLFFVWWWYSLGLRYVLYFCLYIVASVEDFFSFVAMVKSVIFLQPLHQDFSAVGRLMGVLVRLLWLVIGLASLAVVLCLAAFLIGLWVALPIAPLSLWFYLYDKQLLTQGGG